jgi:hypothetical protein
MGKRCVYDIFYKDCGVDAFATGMWQPQRSILRRNVTSIKFVEEGEALVGGTADGVL